jgi:ribosomal protein S11
MGDRKSKLTRPDFFKRLQKKSGLANGILHVNLTKNNTLLTLTDLTGNVLS